MKRRDALKNTALLLGAVSMGSATALMQSCQPSLEDSWEPVFFDKIQANLLSEIAETIIPRTETPGAKDALVSRYIDEYASRFLKPEQQEMYRTGLALFDTISNTRHQKSFIDCELKQRHEVLQAMIDDPAEGKMSPSSVFYRMRSVVNMAFFTSEVGATQVLDHIPIPGDYLGDIPLSETKGRVYS